MPEEYKINRQKNTKCLPSVGNLPSWR